MARAEQANMPKLRFPEFDGEWEPAKAGAAFKNSRAKGEAGLPIYSVTLDRGLVRRDSLDRHMAADAADEVNLRAQEGDLVYNMMRMWQGAVGIAPEECMISPAYVVLAPERETDSKFFDYWFKSSQMLYLLWAYSHGLTSDRLRLYFNDFAQIPIHYPILSEQKKIAAFLGAVDKRLTALRKKRDLLADYKRGAMQQIFSQKIRFTRKASVSSESGNRFRGSEARPQNFGSAFPDWKEKRLGELANLVSGLTYSPDDIKVDGLLVLRSSNVQRGKILLDDRVHVDVDVESSKLTRKGDILLCVRNGSQRLIGKSALVPENIPKATHGAFMLVLRGANNPLVFQIMQTSIFFREVHKNLGATINSINGADLKKFKFWFPTDPDEQQKIADFLSALDAKIDAVAAQITQMEAFKKGLLQQMFV